MPKVYSAALVGLDAELVEVEVDISPGLPATVIVGLPDTAIQEARERVRSAIRNSSAIYPRSRVSINLAPADIPKNGSHFDLPIALSILLSSSQISFNPNEYLIVGELALDGAVRASIGVLPIVLKAKELGFKKAIIPYANKLEASVVDGVEVFAVESLIQVIGLLQGLVQPISVEPYDWSSAYEVLHELIDFKLITGQEVAKRALEIAAAGSHNILLYGPPGTGKTLLAKALPSILPRMSKDEILEVTKIYSITGLLDTDKQVVSRRPFRNPHHSASSIALIGGGAIPRPGEISLAHRGVLFLDELPEFPRYVLENLRQPLEEGRVTIARALGRVSFPSRFILVAAQNPCPCGMYNSPGGECGCTMAQIINYQRRVSGPLLDRIDIFIEISKVDYDKLGSNHIGETSQQIQSRVQRARNIQLNRFAGTKLLTNSEMGIKELRQFCFLGDPEKQLMKQASLKMNLSARAYHRVLKLARTIADLADAPNITTKHLAEALQYRTKSD